MFREQPLNQLAHEAAAVAMGESDVAIFDHALGLDIIRFVTREYAGLRSLAGTAVARKTGMPISPSRSITLSLSLRFWNTPPARPTASNRACRRSSSTCCTKAWARLS